ncbi:MAG: hypothetical protein O3C43_17910 [Verrucomicrobia bacterium]|nr:hypothetical protein [Verrucomicrobiota bacterium]MDA1068367.1 hypothetical protein [Verrucomicrobiota bacterium]
MKLKSAYLLLLLFSTPRLGMAANLDRQAIEKEVFEVLDQFLISFSAKDPVAHVSTLHFPHFRLAGASMTIWETKEVGITANKSTLENLSSTGWDKSIWVHREIISLSEDKVHVNTRFRHLRKDGSEIRSADSLCVLIKRDGRWGVLLRSSFR